MQGGGINPVETYKSTYNVNMNNQSISGLTVGKTYAIVYQNSSPAFTPSVTGGDLIGSAFVSNGAGWSTSTVLDNLFFIKATNTSITITGGNLYGVLIVQLD